MAAWLQLNEMRAAKLQFLQLCSQNIKNVWRKVALDSLMASSGIEGLDGVRFGAEGRGLLRFNQEEGLKTCVLALCEAVDSSTPEVSY